MSTPNDPTTARTADAATAARTAETAAPTTPLRLDIWSDFVCPWCYIGKRRLETALAELDEEIGEVDVVWHAFELDPTQEKGTGENVRAGLVRKKGMPAQQVDQMVQQITVQAAGEGLHYDFDSAVSANTVDAHRLAAYARTRRLDGALHERLLRAHLIEGAVLDDPDTLARLAAEVGIEETDARAVLADPDAYLAEVRDDVATARSIGIGGVPFVVIDQRYGVSGAQPADVFIRALRTAAADRA